MNTETVGESVTRLMDEVQVIHAALPEAVAKAKDRHAELETRLAAYLVIGNKVAQAADLLPVNEPLLTTLADGLRTLIVVVDAVAAELDYLDAVARGEPIH